MKSIAAFVHFLVRSHCLGDEIGNRELLTSATVTVCSLSPVSPLHNFSAPKSVVSSVRCIA
jgi:hypothetical protein